MIYRQSAEAIAEDAPIQPSNPYGLSKLAQERLALRAMEDGLDVRIGRAFNHIGPRQDPSFAASGFAKQIAEIEAGRRPAEIVVGNLDARREATHVCDTVRAYQTIVERGAPGRPYNVSSGQACAVGEILERLIAKAQVDVEVRVDPSRMRPSDVPVLSGNPARIRDEVGWTPAIPSSSWEGLTRAASRSSEPRRSSLCCKIYRAISNTDQGSWCPMVTMSWFMVATLDGDRSQS